MALDREHREIERARGVDLVLAPRDWTAARVEAWLDWGEALACDYPAVDLPDALGPDSALDPGQIKPSPLWGDLSRLGNGERNSAEPKARRAERAGASESTPG